MIDVNHEDTLRQEWHEPGDLALLKQMRKHKIDIDERKRSERELNRLYGSKERYND